ncbi:WD40-repeat-containing domain protein [Melampsora americana]|nr:WD40-repeat-containing domain protein [Melampsora americana]
MKETNQKKKKAKTNGNQVRISENHHHQIKSHSHSSHPIQSQTNLKSALKPTTSNKSTSSSHQTSTSTSTQSISSSKKRPHSNQVKLNQIKSNQIKPTPTPTLHSPNSIKIVFGSYEHLLYGIQINFSSNGSPNLIPLFHFKAHSAPITSIDISPSGTHLATASSTGPLTLWSLSRQRALGTLSPTSASDDHQPGVSHTRFDPTGRLLVAADEDEDGKLSLYRTRDWVLLKRLPGPICFVGFEPIRSTLMLSVGGDRCLRLWDLSRQAQSNRKPIGSVRLDMMADLIQWSPTGDLFVVLTGTIATVYNIKMEPKFTFKSPRGRVHDAKFLIHENQTTHLILACDDGIGRIFNLNDEFEPSCVSELIGHSNRIRAIELIEIDSILYSITISSDGFCNLYKLEPNKWISDRLKDETTQEIQPLLQYDTKGSRLTCLAITGFYHDSNSNENTQTETQVMDEDEDEFGIDQSLVDDDLNIESDSDSGSDEN